MLSLYSPVVPASYLFPCINDASLRIKPSISKCCLTEGEKIDIPNETVRFVEMPNREPTQRDTVTTLCIYHIADLRTSKCWKLQHLQHISCRSQTIVEELNGYYLEEKESSTVPWTCLGDYRKRWNVNDRNPKILVWSGGGDSLGDRWVKNFISGRFSWMKKGKKGGKAVQKENSCRGNRFAQMYSDDLVTSCRDKGRYTHLYICTTTSHLGRSFLFSGIFHRVDICEEAERERGMHPGGCYIFSSLNAAASLHLFISVRISICFLSLGSSNLPPNFYVPDIVMFFYNWTVGKKGLFFFLGFSCTLVLASTLACMSVGLFLISYQVLSCPGGVVKGRRNDEWLGKVYADVLLGIISLSFSSVWQSMLELAIYREGYAYAPVRAHSPWWWFIFVVMIYCYDNGWFRLLVSFADRLFFPLYW